jgi:hypothetical protein
MGRNFFPYHPFKLRAALSVASMLCVVLLAWSLSSAVSTQAPQEMARAGLCLGLLLAMGYVLMRLSPREGWGITLAPTLLKVSRPVEGTLEVPWSAIEEVQRAGRRREVLVLVVGNHRRILVPRHLFGSAAEFEAAAQAIEDRLPPPAHDA